MSQFKSKIDTLSRGKGRKPHKYIALLSMIQLLEEKGFKENKIYYTKKYKDRFAYIFEGVARKNDRNTPLYPFFHLRTSGLYILVPKRDENLWQYSTVTSETFLMDHVACAMLEPEFFEALKDKEVRREIIRELEDNLRTFREEPDEPEIDYSATLRHTPQYIHWRKEPMQELNCLGCVCPEPVLRCRALLAAEQPQEFCVLVDNKASLENVSRFLEKNGYTVSVEQQAESQWALHAVRTEASIQSPQPAPAPKPAAQAARVGKSVVLITTQTLGRGDDVLGQALMGNFIATLPEMGEQLWRIVLLNGGVKLACEEGKALDALKKLVAEGVSLYVCGTCLAHYGLMEAKQVGETTNMLDIVTSLAEADKVIRP